MGTVMSVWNVLKDSGPVPVKGAVHGADDVHAGCIKDLRVDMGENFPYPGPCDRTKASTVLPVGMFYCCIGSDGTIRGCPDQPGR